MKPPQLERHLKTKHPEHEDKLLNFFQWFRLIQYSNHHFTRLNDYCIAVRDFLLKSKRKKTPHATGEALVPPAMVKMAEIIHRKPHHNQLKCLPLSENTVRRCTGNTAEDWKKQVFKQITWCGRFALPLDESTGVSNMSQLVIFARFSFNNEIQEELVFF